MSWETQTVQMRVTEVERRNAQVCVGGILLFHDLERPTQLYHRILAPPSYGEAISCGSIFAALRLTQCTDFLLLPCLLTRWKPRWPALLRWVYRR